jgi:hypothetical protein
MGKKNFKGGFNSLLTNNSTTPEPIAQKKTTKVLTTIVADEDMMHKIRSIAYWERLKIKDVMQLMFKAYLDKYEAKHGPVKPMPKANE